MYPIGHVMFAEEQVYFETLIRTKIVLTIGV